MTIILTGWHNYKWNWRSDDFLNVRLNLNFVVWFRNIRLGIRSSGEASWWQRGQVSPDSSSSVRPQSSQTSTAQQGSIVASEKSPLQRGQISFDGMAEDIATRGFLDMLRHHSGKVNQRGMLTFWCTFLSSHHKTSVWNYFYLTGARFVPRWPNAGQSTAN